MEKHYFLVVALCLSILLTAPVLADSTQQYNKIYLNPFYVNSISAGGSVLFQTALNPPDRISSVTSAIIAFNAQINGQTQNFTLRVNGQACNPSSYAVATAFSTTGNIQFYFDCTNAMTRAGTYQVNLTSSVATGAITGWLETTYMNDPSGNVKYVGGTDYWSGERATVFLQLQDTSGLSVNNASCNFDMYNTTNMLGTPIFNKQPMIFRGADGIYFYQFSTIGLPEGVYPLDAECTYNYDNFFYHAYSTTQFVNWTTNAGLFVGGNPFALNLPDDSSYVEWSGSPNITFTISNVSANTTKIDLYWISWSGASRTYTFYAKNFTSGGQTVIGTMVSNSANDPNVKDLFTVTLTPSNHVNSTGSVQITIVHGGGGSTGLWVDWITLKAFKNTTYITEVKGSSEVHIFSTNITSAISAVVNFSQVLTDIAQVNSTVTAINNSNNQQTVFLTTINATTTQNNVFLQAINSTVNSISSYLNGFVTSILTSINQTVTAINGKDFAPNITVNTSFNITNVTVVVNTTNTTVVVNTTNVTFSPVLNVTVEPTFNITAIANVTLNVTNTTVVVNVTNTTVVVNTTNVTVVENITNTTVVVNTVNTTVVINTTNVTVSPVVNLTLNQTLVANVTLNQTLIANVTVNVTELNNSMNQLMFNVQEVNATTQAINVTANQINSKEFAPNITVNLTTIQNVTNTTVIVNVTNTTVVVNTTNVTVVPVVNLTLNQTLIANVTVNLTVNVTELNDTLNQILGLTQQINQTTLNNYELLLSVNGTVALSQQELLNILALADETNATAHAINLTTQDIYSLLLNMNQTLGNISINFTPVLNAIQEVNTTTLRNEIYLQNINQSLGNFSVILDYLNSINGTVQLNQQTLGQLLGLAYDTNATVFLNRATLLELLSNTQEINATTLTNLGLLQELNFTTHASEGYLQQINQTTIDNNVILLALNFTTNMNNALLATINATVNLNNGLLLQINSTVTSIEATATSISNYLTGFVTTSLNDIYALLGQVNTTTLSINAKDFNPNITVNTSFNVTNVTVVENLTTTTVVVNTTNTTVVVNTTNVTFEPVFNVTNTTVVVNMTNVTYVDNNTFTTVIINVTNTTYVANITVNNSVVFGGNITVNATAVINTTQLMNDLLNMQITQTIL